MEYPYAQCPIKPDALYKVTKNQGANARENQYADWHMANGQRLKAKYRNGRSMKSCR